MARKIIDTDLQPTLLRPAANPVDTFVDPGPSPLRGLAESLGKINSGLSTVLDKRKKEQDDKDALLGEQKFYADNAEGFAEGVRQDRIPANSSKAFKGAYKNAEGHVAGGDLRLKFSAFLDERLPTLGDDPAEYDKAVAEFISQNVADTTDPDVLRGLLPQVRNLHQEGYARYTDYRSKSVYHGSEQAHGAGIAQDVDEFTRDGLSDPDGTDYAGLATRVADWRESFIASGGRVEDADKMAIDTITAKALQLRDRGLLDVLKEKVPGQDYSYAETPYGLTVFENTKDALDVIDRRAASDETTAYNRERQVKGDAVRSEVTSKLAENPGHVFDEEFLREARKWDDTIDDKIAGWRRSMGTGFSDDAKIKVVYDEVMQGGGKAAVVAANEAGVFGTPEDLNKALKFAEDMQENAKAIASIVDDNLFKQFHSTFDVMTKGKTTLGDPIAGTSKEGFEAQHDFRMAAIEWAMRNPDATFLERQKALADMGKGVLDRIVPADPNNPLGSDAGTYERREIPEEADQEIKDALRNPFSEEFKMAAEKEKEANLQEDVDTLLGGMTPEQRKVWEERAKEQGFTSEELARQVLGGDDTADQQPPAGVDPSSTESVPKPQAKAEPISYTPGKGLAALVTSNKRGKAPDVDNLRPAVASGVVNLQKAWGKELPIVSGYRSAARNKKAKGAKKSQHIHGNAVDIDVSSLPKEEQVRLIKLASSQGFTGIGVYGGSLHLDYGGRRAWGPNYHKETIPSWAQGAIAEHMANTAVAPEVGTPMSKEDAMAFLQEALDTSPADMDFAGAAQLPDQDASRLANLIKQREASGNYNAVSGNPRASNDLGKLTLNQIMAMQVAAKARTGSSPAVGGYQFMPNTLKDVKAALKLTGNEKFTPKLQDQLFMALLERRGWASYKSGKLSMRRFALNLSQEWAALPDPRTGKSYYAGDGKNKSRTKTSEVYAALGLG